MLRSLVLSGLTLTICFHAWGQQSPSESACQSGDAEACFYTGAEYAQGQGVPADKQQAVQFFLKSCDMGIPDGCSTSGILISMGEGNLEKNTS